MKNKIGSKMYYFDFNNCPNIGFTIDIQEYTILKETPKKFKMGIKKISNFWGKRSQKQLYKKENINISGTQDLDNMFGELKKNIDAILNSDDNSKNVKTKVKEAYNNFMKEKTQTIIEYFNNIL